MKLFLRGVVLVASLSSLASAQSNAIWTGGTSGSFETPANWLFGIGSGTGGLPDSSTDVIIGAGTTGISELGNPPPPLYTSQPYVGGNITITQNSNESISSFTTLSLINYTGSGTVTYTIGSGDTLTITGNNTPSGESVINDSNLVLNGKGTLDIENGFLTVGQESDLGQVSTLTLTAGTIFTAPGSGGVVIGDGAKGGFIMTGGNAIFGDNLDIGDIPASSGFVVQTGTNASSGTPAGGSTLSVAGFTTIGTTAGGAASSYNLIQGPAMGTVTANFNGGLFVDQTGTFTQSGGNVTIGSDLFLYGTYTQVGPVGTVVNIAGDLNESATGVLGAQVTPTANDLYNVTGTGAGSTLTGSLVVTGAGTTTNVTLITDQAGTLNTAGLTLSDPFVLFLVTPNAGNDGFHYAVDTVELPTATYAQSPNQLAVANSIDPFRNNPSVAYQPYLTALNTLTQPSQVAAALQSLSPSSLQYMSNITLENSTFSTEEVDGHLANLRSGYAGLDASGLSMAMPGMDSSLGRSMLAYYKPGPDGVNYYDDSTETTRSPGAAGKSSKHTVSDSEDPLAVLSGEAVAPHPKTRFSEFISGNVVLADLKQDQSTTNAATSKASYTAENLAAGVSFRMTNSLAAGVLFDYDHTDAKTDSQGSKTTVDSFAPGIYGTYFKNGFYANGLFSYGLDEYKNTRNISFGGLGVSALSSPSGDHFIVNGTTGYDFQPDPHLVVGPTLGMQYTHVDVNSFQETGANPVGYAIQDQSLDSLRSRLGAHLSYQFRSESVLFQPHFTAAWQHEFLDDNSVITAQNGLGSSAFTFQSAELGRDSALLGFGLSATFDDSINAYLNYLAEIGANDYFIQSVQGGVKAQF